MFVLSLAMVVAMMPFLPATVYAAVAPEIEIEGCTPVAGEEMPTVDDVTNLTHSDYTLEDLTWLNGYSNEVSGKFKPGKDYIAVLKFRGNTELEAEDAKITIDGNTFYYDEDNVDIVVNGETITFSCYFHGYEPEFDEGIKIPYFAIWLPDEQEDVIITYDASSTYRMLSTKGTKPVTFKWWKCDKYGNTTGKAIYTNTTGKFSMKKLGWNKGLHYVAVKAKDANGNWSNKVVLKLKIYYDINDASIKVKNPTYTGKGGRHPTVTIKAKINGVNKTLKKGTDYTIKCKKSSANRKNVGLYSFLIEPKGYYYYSYDDDTDGEYDYYDRDFKINPKKTYIRKVTPGSKKLKVTWKKQSDKMSKSRITGYQVQIATNKSFTKGKRTKTVKGYSKLSKTFKNLKGGKKYYVRVRTYKVVYGVKCYSKWSKVKSCTTKW